MAFTSVDGIPAPGQDQRAFRVCKMETACRFDKDHFENGPNCEAAHCEEQKDLFDEIKTNTWTEMHNISAAMRRAVSHSGLSPARAIAVAAVLTPLLDPNPSPIATIDVEITGLLQKLFQARKASEQERYRFAGDMIAFEDSWRYTKYHLKRNREITLNDEHTREVAIENASIPLTEPEIERLRAAGSYDVDCVVCDEEMGDPQDSHAAVRLKCDAHHSIGKNCWMRFNRRKKGQYTDGIRCHSCADKIIGTWGVPINLELLDAYDIGTSTPLGLTLPGDLLE
ncbi:hypothetical protein CH35J_003405 [Colletotrichum higginsianum]|nr:hypothetical protein CH35J_003405 [Colletotrichum higginsianum]